MSERLSPQREAETFASMDDRGVPEPSDAEEKRARLFRFIEAGATEDDFPSFAAAINDYVAAELATVRAEREAARAALRGACDRVAEQDDEIGRLSAEGAAAQAETVRLAGLLGERDAELDLLRGKAAAADGYYRQTKEQAGEISRLLSERDELAARARRVAASHDQFIYEHSDPGTEALSAQYELINTLAGMDCETRLPLQPVENALRVALALLDEYDENVTPGEIRSTLAECLPRDDMSDRRRRIYIDGKGNAWMDQSVTSDGTRWISPLAGSMPTGAEPEGQVRESTGSLREIGRCW